MCSRRLLTLGGSVAVSLLVVSSAFAQLTKDEQKCIDGYNNKLRLVSQQAGKDYRSCIKNAGKGQANADNCLATDGPGKISGKAGKVTELYTGGKCNGMEPIQQGAATGNAAHTNGPLDLTRDIFGDPVLDGTVVSVDKDTAKCQDKMVQRSGQAFTEIIKAHRSCVKNGMKSGAISDATTLDATCGTFNQIDAGGKAGAKLSKLGADVSAACASLAPATVAPGECAASGSAAALGTCLQARTRCRACETLNTADGQDIDCDTFDNGLADSSCGGVTYACNLANTSSLVLGTQSLGLPVVPSGSLAITCGGQDGNGDAACSCEVVSFNAIVIAGIGDVCVNPASGCASGTLDCNGGTTQDVQLVTDHNIGACAGDAACQTACDSYCGGLGAGFARISYGCEGFCQGGANAGNACTSDSQCTGGQCSGGEPVAHAGTCNCSCQASGLGAASGAGSLSCEVGTQINVELSPTGICGDAAPGIQLPPVCGAVTTTTAVGGVLDANNSMGTTLPPYATLTNPPGIGTYPNSTTGTGLSCGALPSVTGLKLVGHLAFPDSTLGDILSINTFVCQ